MMRKFATITLYVLLACVIIGSIVTGIWILPLLASEAAISYPEVAYIKEPVLLISEVLIVFLIIGCFVIYYLLFLFSKHKVFTTAFVKWMQLLAYLCLAVCFALISILIIISVNGGPGPMGLYLIALIGIILIVATVIVLISEIIKEATSYKEESDLTV